MMLPVHQAETKNVDTEKRSRRSANADKIQEEGGVSSLAQRV